ncbi:MAG TPA: DUF1573 domain-containing protein [Bacteroidales bacterium]|nr:DUF1573 domain-containing protein [Bacteroidales bacterium]
MRKFFAIFVIFVFAISVSCSQTAGKDQTGENGPKIEFTYTEYDYGTITEGADGTSEFVFKNTGNEPLILSNVQSTCGCTVPSWPKEPVKPGETAKIIVSYRTNRVGPINKSITVISNADSGPIVLRIKGNIVPKPVENTEAKVN